MHLRRVNRLATESVRDDVEVEEGLLSTEVGFSFGSLGVLLSSDVVFVVFVVVVLVVAVLFWGGDDLGTVVFKGADKFSFLFWEIKEGFVWKLCMLRSLSERATVAILFDFFFLSLCVCVFWILVGKESKNLEEERLEARSLFMASINR